MPDFTAMAGRMAGVLTFAAFISYIIAIKSKKVGPTRPNRATWIIWAVVNGMIAASYYKSGATETVWVPLCDGLGAFIVIIFSFKYGESRWTYLDRGCLAAAGLSALLWWLFDSPLVALFTNIVIDLIAAVPTIQKSFCDPDGEDRVTWRLFFLGSVINMFAIDRWVWIIYLYPLSQILSIGLITCLVFRLKRIKSD